MVFRNMFKGKKGGQFRSHKEDGTRTALELEETENDETKSVVASEVSSLSAYSDDDMDPRQPLPPTTNKVSQFIFLLPRGFCTSADDTVLEGIDQASLARRKKIFEDDLDPDLAWDTTMTVDTDRYKSNDPPMSSWMAWLVCV